MGNLFSGKPLKEQIREQKRMLDRSVRALERDRASLERDEKKLVMEIKKAAKANQMTSVKIMAKDLVRIRKSEEKFVNLSAQLRAISLQMTAMASTQALTESMKNVTKSMTALNKSVNLKEFNKVMQEFMKQNEQMEMKQDMIGDSLDDTLLSDDDEKESELIVSQVLDELGVSLSAGLVDVPGQKKVEKEQVKQDNHKDTELESRFNNLGK